MLSKVRTFSKIHTKKSWQIFSAVRRPNFKIKVALEPLFYTLQITSLKFDGKSQNKKLINKIVIEVTVQKFGVTLESKPGNIHISECISAIFSPIFVVFVAFEWQ